MTKQKTAIITAMQQNTGHHTAEEIYSYAKRVYPGIVRATVYNNLNAMVSEKLIRRICQSGEPDRYDRIPIPHEHIICSNCGKVVDVWLNKFKSRLEDEIGHGIDDYELVIHCLCDDCRSLNAKSNN